MVSTVPTGLGPCVHAPPVASGYPTLGSTGSKMRPLAASALYVWRTEDAAHPGGVWSPEDAGQCSATISSAVGAAYSSARLLVRGGLPSSVAGPGVHTWVASVAGLEARTVVTASVYRSHRCPETAPQRACAPKGLKCVCENASRSIPSDPL